MTCDLVLIVSGGQQEVTLCKRLIWLTGVLPVLP